MNIRDIFSSLRGRDNDHILRTPYGTFNLAKGEDQARVKHVIMQGAHLSAHVRCRRSFVRVYPAARGVCHGKVVQDCR